jgi:hypothetical protein
MPSHSIGSHAGRTPRRRILHAMPIVVGLLLGCDSNPFDEAQVPQITVTPVVALPVVRFSWQPAGAQLLRVYRGPAAGDGYSDALVWSIAATGNNTLVSGLEYGDNPLQGGTTDVAAKPMIPGQAYTVQITRRDPKGKGDGFTNTANRYVNTRTFAVPASIPAP